MISLGSKRFADIPKALLGIRAKKLLHEIISTAPNHKVKGLYNSKSVRKKMRKYFGDKCVFCESVPVGSSSFRIDHFRPKKFIKNVDQKVHYGYYWLALEWTNLVQLCEQCNASKSNNFPVTGNHVNALTDPTALKFPLIGSVPLSKEDRHLLHPEIDNVESHLSFSRDGLVIAKPGSLKGSESINLYGLNRGDLVLMRKKKVDYYFKEIVYILNKFEDAGADRYALMILNDNLNDFFKHLLQEQEEKATYSRLGFYMFDQFESFFIQSLPVELVQHKSLLRSFYNALKNINSKTSP